MFIPSSEAVLLLSATPQPRPARSLQPPGSGAGVVAGAAVGGAATGDGVVRTTAGAAREPTTVGEATGTALPHWHGSRPLPSALQTCTLVEAPPGQAQATCCPGRHTRAFGLGQSPWAWALAHGWTESVARQRREKIVG
jgi:hypothetical protein